MPAYRVSVLLAVSFVACESHGVPEGEANTRSEFRADFEGAERPSGIPPGWVPAETNGRGTPATWGMGLGHRSGKSFGVLATENFGNTFNLAILDGLRAADFEARLRVKSGTGQIDQGGGLCFRLRDASNYYVTRWNPLEKNLRLYTVKDGVRTQIAGATVEADPAEWHELGVRMQGSSIRVSLDGRVVLEHEDTSFEESGMFALWTKADAATMFDDLRVW